MLTAAVLERAVTLMAAAYVARVLKGVHEEIVSPINLGTPFTTKHRRTHVHT
jgi:hypothetical protein